jgi:hypothetical protein
MTLKLLGASLIAGAHRLATLDRPAAPARA